jgi:hypothetical protein
MLAQARTHARVSLYGSVNKRVGECLKMRLGKVARRRAVIFRVALEFMSSVESTNAMCGKLVQYSSMSHLKVRYVQGANHRTDACNIEWAG